MGIFYIIFATLLLSSPLSAYTRSPDPALYTKIADEWLMLEKKSQEEVKEITANTNVSSSENDENYSEEIANLNPYFDEVSVKPAARIRTR